MRNLGILVLSMVMGSVAFAQDLSGNTVNTISRNNTLMAVEAGIRQQSGGTDLSSMSVKSQTGYELGVSAIFPIHVIGIRTGLFYSVRPIQLTADATGSNTTLTFSYFDIPAQISYQVGDYAYIYGGILLSFNLDGTSSDSSFKVTNTSGTLVPIQLGAAFKFAPDIGLNVYFESSSASVADHVNNFRAVGVNVFFSFD